MNNPIANNPFFQEQQGFDLNKWILRLRKLIPWFILSFAIFITAAWFYLRLTPAVYTSSAVVLLKDNATNEDPLLQDLKISTTTKLVENEMKVLKSPDLMKLVVTNEQLYTTIQTAGSYTVGKQKIYKNNFPLTIAVRNPNAITKEFNFTLTSENGQWKMQSATNTVPIKIDTGKLYSVGSVLITFRNNTNPDRYKELPENKFLITLVPIDQAIYKYSSALDVASSSTTSSVINLALSDNNQESATSILETLLEVYNQNSLDIKNSSGSNTLQFLDGRLALVKGGLDKVEGSIQSYKASNGVMDVASESDQSLTNYNELDKQKSQQQNQINIISNLEKDLVVRQDNPSLVPSTLGISEPTLSALIARHNGLILDKERLQQMAGDANPGIVDLKEQINTVHNTLLQSVRNLKNSYVTTMSSLESKSGEVGGRIRALPKFERELGQIDRSHGVQEQLYLFLLQKREERAMALASNTPDARTIVNPKSIGKVKPNNQSVWGIAILLALILPIAVSLLKDFMNNTIVDLKEVERKSIVPVIGELTQLRRVRTPIVVTNNAHTLIAEQFRTLRTAISIFCKASNSQTILVTSRNLGEGKSFVSLNLAAAFALLNKKVVILEMDLRKPKLATSLNMESGEGMIAYLSEQAPLADLLLTVPETNGKLKLLPAGSSTVYNAAELLDSPALAEMIVELKKTFDHIIIDSPPFGLVTDASLIRPYADVTINVVRQGYTTKDIYSDLNQRVTASPEHKEYIILNGVKLEKGTTLYNGYIENGYLETDKQSYKRLLKKKKLETT